MSGEEKTRAEMLEESLVAVAEAARARLAEEIKGLSERPTAVLYGTHCDYVWDGTEGGTEDLPAGWKRLAKEREDFEVYVLCQAGGMFQGHETGRAGPRRAKGAPAALAVEKSVQYIHVLLPAEYGRLRSVCGISHEALAARGKVLETFPRLSLLRMFFEGYLRAVYRTMAGDEERILRNLAEEHAGGENVAAFEKAWDEAATLLKSQRRTVLFDFREDARMRIYMGTGAEKRLVNGPLLGEEETEEEEEEEETAPIADEGGYDPERLRGATVFRRRAALLEEAARLAGEDGGALVETVALAESKRLEPFLRSVDAMADLEDPKAWTAERRRAGKLLLTRAEGVLAAASKFARRLTRLGIDPEGIKRYRDAVHRLRRRLQIVG